MGCDREGERSGWGGTRKDRMVVWIEESNGKKDYLVK
jgi:hypothetical protein